MLGDRPAFVPRLLSRLHLFRIFSSISAGTRLDLQRVGLEELELLAVVGLGQRRFAELLRGHERPQHVLLVVGLDDVEPAPGEVELARVEIDEQRIEAHRHLAEAPFDVLDEGADAEARQPGLEDLLGGVQVLEDEALVAAQVTVELLVGRRRVEVGPVEIFGVVRRALLLPARAVLLAYPGSALRPGWVERAEAGGPRLVAPALEDDAGVLDVGQLERRVAAADRVRP